MKETYYEIDDKKFQQLAKNWYTQKTAWKMLRLLSWFFLLAGVASIVVVAGIAFQPPVPDIKIALMIAPMGFIPAFPLFCFAYVTKSQAVRQLGKPFTSMSRIFLVSDDSGFRFGYHDCYDFDRRGSALVHQIAYANIHHVEVDQDLHLFTVVGRTERVEYIDLSLNVIDYQFTSGQFGNRASFSFFLALENEQEFLDELKAHYVNIQFVQRGPRVKASELFHNTPRAGDGVSG